MSNLNTVSQKILEGLEQRKEVPFLLKLFGTRVQKAWATRPAPRGQVSLGLFLAEYLDSEDFVVLEQLEADQGEEAANQWLCDVLARSGQYQKFDLGFVQAVRETHHENFA